MAATRSTRRRSTSALRELSEICLGLPEATCERSDPHAGFRVRGRTFAYYLVDHRGNEGITGLVCKGDPVLIEVEPDLFYRPAYLHHRGWVGYRLDTANVDWDRVEGLVVASYRMVAPKRLAALTSV